MYTNTIDAITDMCKVLDTQFRYDRASMRDISRLNKYEKVEKKRNSEALIKLNNSQASLAFVNSNTNIINSSSTSSSSSSSSGSGSVFKGMMHNLSNTYDSQMRLLGDAQMEEHRAKLVSTSIVWSVCM